MAAREHGPRLAILVDPAKQSAEEAAERAMAAVGAGARMVLVGGSTGTTGTSVAATVEAIQEALELRIWAASQHPSGTAETWEAPVVLFPGTGEALSVAADGILFMMLMNSRERRFLVDEQLRGAPVLARTEVVPLPTGYVVIEPGGEVGRVGEADLVGMLDVETAVAYAHTAAAFGFPSLYLEAGSGAERPVHAALIGGVRERVPQLTLLVGGGLREAADVLVAAESGADWVVVGTLLEHQPDAEAVAETVRGLVRALR